jgi:anaphase-promoting complex subunit 6
VDESLACRYLAAQCLVSGCTRKWSKTEPRQVHQEKYVEALELLGESNPFKGNNGPETRNADNGIKVRLPTVPQPRNLLVQLESSLCYLRAILHLRLSSFTLAKESFMEALAIDVKNYDAFRELIEGQMMTGEEGSTTIGHLNENLTS